MCITWCFPGCKYILDLDLNIYGYGLMYLPLVQQLMNAVHKQTNLEIIIWNSSASFICVAGSMNDAISAASSASGH
jgi:hypothetical protein